ncbi:MAG: D-aminoacyl-tRNA deacylase [Bacteroidales bacterium]
MRVVIQRVKTAKVEVTGATVGEINKGLLTFAGFESSDSDEDLNWMADKIIKLRIFDDNEGVMNLSVTDIAAEILVVSQFTLHAKTKKGNRPSYMQAAPPAMAESLYNKFLSLLKGKSACRMATGLFGAKMDVALVNDGPVTIIIDSKNRE